MPRTKPFTCATRANKVKNCLDSYARLCDVDEDALGKAIGTDRRGYRRRHDNPEKFSLGELWQLAQYLKCPIEELVGGESNKAEIEKMAAIFKCVLREMQADEVTEYMNNGD